MIARFLSPTSSNAPSSRPAIRRRALFSTVTAAALAGAMGSLTGAADISWVATGSASFNDENNWSPAQVPTSADIAIFNNNATGTVALTTNSAVNDLSFRNTSGSLVVDTTGGNLSFNRWLIGTGAGQVNNITFSGGTFQHTSTGQVFSIGAANGSNGNRFTITGNGVRVLSTATGTGSNLGVAGSNNNEFHVTDGAFVDIRNNINVGVIGANPSTGNLINISNSTFQITNGNRGIFLRQGTLTVNNAYADFGGFIVADDTGNTAVINLNSGTFFARGTRVNNGQPLRIGDGGAIPAVYGMSYSTPTLSVANGLLINSNGKLTGSGLITGNVSGVAGAKVMPGIIGQPPLTTDDRNYGTFSVNGNWDNTNIDLTFNIENFPLRLAGTTIPPFQPPVGSVQVNGEFTHGGSITIDLATYVAPEDQNYDLRLLGFNSAVGSPTSTPVSFVNGSPLPFEWRFDGLYVLFAVALGPSVWNVDASGDWTNASNWSGGVPNSAGAVANFGTIITAPATVTLDAPITVGAINFDSPIAYTLSGANPLTLSGAAESTTGITVTSGSHAIQSAVVVNDPLTVDVSASASLAMTGGVTAATDTVTKQGGGQLTLGQVTAAGLNVDAGTARIQPNGTVTGTAVVKALSVNAGAGAELDLTNNALVVDYDSTDPSADIRALLVSGYAAGAWNGPGINSSAVASNPGTSVGYAQASDVGVPPIFGSADATSVLVRFTIGGDANLDGVANIGDFGRLAANFNQPGEWASGDFNYDGTVGIGDFSILAANFNQSVPASTGRPGAVPEPAASAMLLLATGAFARRVRRG